MERLNFRACFGPSARHKMRKASPYASLLLDVASGLSHSDLSQLRLLLQIDRVLPRKKTAAVKNPSELILAMDTHGLISSSDTNFLEHLLVKIGRKDLEKVIIKYHSQREQPSHEESTSPKVIESSSFTALRPKSMLVNNKTPSTIIETQKAAEAKMLAQEDHALLERPVVEGSSVVEEADTENLKPDGEDIIYSQESAKLSQMSVDFTPDSSSLSQMSVEYSCLEKSSSQMSISDDEKMNFL